MANEVSICNQALGWIGGNLITSLNENSKEAILCNANYEELRDAVLEEHRWRFALATFKLGVASRLPDDDNNWRYQYAYNLPQNVLHVLRVFDNPNCPYQTQWERKDNAIYTDAATIYIDTTLRMVPPSSFSTLFRQALAARIARDLCLAISQNATLYDKMVDKYEEALDAAANSDGMQGVNEEIPAGELILARSREGLVSG